MLADITLQNTLSGKKEKLITKEPGVVHIYACGPTVYGLTHVGNARTALFLDLVIRVLKLAGYKTNAARNITDIDDKIIKVANDSGTSFSDVSKKYADTYFSELKLLNAISENHTPHATEHIPEMIRMMEGLIKSGHAYVAATPFGSDVYFSVNSFKEYGKLSRRKTEDMLAGARIEPGEAKKNPLDFALWKAAKVGEPSWSSPWGEGRPGWHIECSAMIHKIFPKGLDIHLGGLDLVFPHHENEIAQSESFEDKALATYWLHGGMLTLAREKMSKSLGNIFTTEKFLSLYGPEVLRLMVLQHHYRGPMDFTDDSIHQSEGLLTRLYTCKQYVQDSKGSSTGVSLPEELANLEKNIRDALFDDFNSAKAIGHILKNARLCFKEQRKEYWAAWGVSLKYLEGVLGILGSPPKEALAAIEKARMKRMCVDEKFCQEIQAVLAQREAARQAKNFAESDRLRAELEAKGVKVMDGPDGVSWVIERRDT